MNDKGALTAAFTTLPVPVWLLDEDRKLCGANEAGAALLGELGPDRGLAASDRIGQPLLELLPGLTAEVLRDPSDRNAVDLATAEGKKTFGLRWARLSSADASGCSWSLTFLPAAAAVKVPEPAPLSVRELWDEDEWHRTLLENLPQRIFFKDRSGMFVAVNEAFVRDFGLTRNQVIGKTDFDLFQTDMAAKFREDDRRIMEARRTETIVERNEVQGHARFVEVVKVPVLADGGPALGILGVFTDITERKQIAEALAHERDLLHTLMDNIPDLIYFKDTRSRFTRINQAQALSLGLEEPEQATGKSDFDFYPDERASEFFEDEQQIIRTGEPLVNKVERASGHDQVAQWLLTTKVPTFDSDGQVNGLVGISRDVTERMRAEEELQRTARELARSNEELQQFAYVASHDLQEPLRMVASYTQLLARRYRDRLDDDAQEFIGFAVDGATRMQGLINDLLAYSRVGTRGREAQPTALSEVLARAVTNLQAAIRESGAEVTNDALPVISADPTQMLQLLQNLIGNAIKFRGKEIPRVHVSAELQDSEWRITVRDNGIGIDPAYRDRIFIIFQRLHGKTEYPGSGIGLSICKKIVNRHGGNIWVESEEGRGATFFFTLPALQTAPGERRGG